VSASGLRRPAVLYTAGRFGLFVLVALLVWLGTGMFGAPLTGIPLLLAALILSSIASIFVLSRQRALFAEALTAHRAARTAQLAARRARLDDAS
jgi:hypothetical protein